MSKSTDSASGSRRQTGTVTCSGGDAGVGFVSTHHREQRTTSTVLCNQTAGRMADKSTPQPTVGAIDLTTGAAARPRAPAGGEAGVSSGVVPAGTKHET